MNCYFKVNIDHFTLPKFSKEINQVIASILPSLLSKIKHYIIFFFLTFIIFSGVRYTGILTPVSKATDSPSDEVANRLICQDGRSNYASLASSRPNSVTHRNCTLRLCCTNRCVDPKYI